MRLTLGKCIASSSCAFLFVICSCEKHRVGEYPEVQKEHSYGVKATDESSSATTSPTPLAKPTPAEFFPQSSPH
jgi:hypothetical protein